MTLHTCPRQAEVAELATSGHWPHACPLELRAHVDSCKSCASLALITEAFQASRAASTAQARLPAAGAIWWRAQLRRRNAAVERIGKPVQGAYVFAFAIMLLAAGGLIAGQARHGLDWLPRSRSLAAQLQMLNPADLIGSVSGFALLIAVLASLALAAGIAVYLAAERQ